MHKRPTTTDFGEVDDTGRVAYLPSQLCWELHSNKARTRRYGSRSWLRDVDEVEIDQKLPRGNEVRRIGVASGSVPTSRSQVGLFPSSSSASIRPVLPRPLRRPPRSRALPRPASTPESVWDQQSPVAAAGMDIDTSPQLGGASTAFPGAAWSTDAATIGVIAPSPLSAAAAPAIYALRGQNGSSGSNHRPGMKRARTESPDRVAVSLGALRLCGARSESLTLICTDACRVETTCARSAALALDRSISRRRPRHSGRPPPA